MSRARKNILYKNHCKDITSTKKLVSSLYIGLLSDNRDLKVQMYEKKT